MVNMGLSINGGIQNGLFFMENPIKMDDLGVGVAVEVPSRCRTAAAQWMCPGSWEEP